MIGRTISHYKITAKLGQGGMGIVYKAEDTKLKRPVALKFLAAHLLNDEEIRARFTREAEAAAGLNHPNICHVYEIDEAEGKTFISMAFVEGDSLEKKSRAAHSSLRTCSTSPSKPPRACRPHTPRRSSTATSNPPT